jgi:histidine triad (HIT) family protein
MATDCIFCRIVAGEIPSALVYEDETVVAFLDIAPVNPGHVLVIPRRHAERLTDLSEAELAACARTVRRVARAVLEATGWPGLNVLQNNDGCAGQVIEHCHFHVIPRSPDDGMKFGWRQLGYEEGEIERYRERIAAKVEEAG